MILACAMVLAGGFAAQHSRLSLSSDICILLIVASLLMLLMLRSAPARCPAFVLLGACWLLLTGQQIVDSRLQPRFAGDSLLADVRVVNFPRDIGNSVVMVVAPLDDERLPPRSRVSWYRPDTAVSIGDVWRLELRLKRPRGLSNPGVFDREAWLFRNRIHATGYVVDGKRNRRLQTGAAAGIDAFRGRFVVRGAKATPTPEVAAVLAAIGVGARHGISAEQWARYAVSGTSHLMAISGLHIGLAASVAFLVARLLTGFLCGARNAHLLSILAAAASAGAYAVVSGLGVPAQRAALMLLLMAGTVLRRRSIHPAETLALAAAAVFAMNPVATMAPGFHLSFSAVLLLLWLASARPRSFRARSLVANVGDKVRQLAAIQVFLLFGLMPLTVIMFQRIALLAPLVNLLAVPLFSVVTVPFTLLGLVLGDTFAGGADAALKVAAGSIAFLEAVIARAVSLPFMDIQVIALRGYFWLVVMLPALFTLLPRGWPGRYVAVPAVAAIVLQSPLQPPEGCIDTHVLDVGQGLATVVQSTSHTLVFDTGASFRGGGSIAQHVIVPFLAARGLHRVDWLVVSHADTDHSGGVDALFDNLEIGALLAGEPLDKAQAAAALCSAGQVWNADGVLFRILHPQETAPQGGNDASCVALVATGRHGMLLTGDIEAGAERQITENFALTPVDVVVVPHHGSLTSSSPAFVNAVAPRLAIVSAGFENRWGLPRPEVVARWTATGAQVLNTATSGAVSFRLCRDSGLAAPRLDRQERARFWRDGAH